MRYIDTHCHLQYPAYDQTREGIIEELRTLGIGAILVGTDLPMSRAAVALASMHTDFYATVGVHPNHAGDGPYDAEELSMLAHHPKVVAIGECGVDYFRPEALSDEVIREQHAVFRAHMTLADETGKPLMIHARPRKGTMDAYHDIAELLAERPGVRAAMHFFVGGPAEVERLAALGAYFSYPSMIAYAREYDEAVRAVPLDRLLTETDSFFPAPPERADRRNDSTYVPMVVEALAKVRGEDPEELRRQVLRNAEALFARPFLA